MYYILVIFNILIYSTKAQSINRNNSLGVSPNWNGLFHTTAQCDVDKCCCIYGLVNLSKVKPNYLRFESQLEGQNCPDVRRIDATATMPTGFKTELFLMGGLVDITLSEDSRIITLNNQKAPTCNGGAIRDHATSIAPIDPIKMVLMIVALFLGKNRFDLD